MTHYQKNCCSNWTFLWWVLGLALLIAIIVGIIWTATAVSSTTTTTPSGLFFTLGGQRPATSVSGTVPLKLVTSTGVTEVIQVANNSSFLFQHQFKQGESYTVTVDLLGSSCTVVNGQGTFTNGNVNNLIVNCLSVGPVFSYEE